MPNNLIKSKNVRDTILPRPHLAPSHKKLCIIFSHNQIKNNKQHFAIFRDNKLWIRATNLQTTQPPYSDSGALTTRVNRITIGLTRLEDSPAADFLPGPGFSIQFGQCQSPSGTHSKSKQAASQKKSSWNINERKLYTE